MKQDDLRQKISAWIDDENDDAHVFSEMLKQEDGIKTFESYHAIRAVLKQESCEHWKAGFSDKVATAIADEPAILAPSAFASKKKVFTGWAVAASVALAVVLGVQMVPVTHQSAAEQVVQNSTLDQKSDTMLAEYHVTEDERAELERINTLFSQFSEQSSLSNDGSLPYVRVVSGEQVKTFRMSPTQFRQVMMELERRNQEAKQKAEQELNK